MQLLMLEGSMIGFYSGMFESAHVQGRGNNQIPRKQLPPLASTRVSVSLSNERWRQKAGTKVTFIKTNDSTFDGKVTTQTPDRP
jgi:hypothetical protein